MPKRNKFQLSIGNVNYSINISEMAYGLYDIKVNDETFRISIADMLFPTVQKTSEASTKGGISNASKVVSGVPDAVSAIDGVIKAAMPGTVMTIKVNAGDTVRVGDILLTLETMKMENSIKSNRAGKIKEIKVQPGKFVNVGDPLMVIE